MTYSKETALHLRPGPSFLKAFKSWINFYDILCTIYIINVVIVHLLQRCVTCMYADVYTQRILITKAKYYNNIYAKSS